ncbi:autotransporter domain-containing protein [Nitratireductor aquimarinus]|uniref:autotransporter outer membrane beta-barrel domain-containing protein n=1 Tax=Nitratireductor aquimarinus TaxID=889300 RepID=UPI00398F76CD
MTTNNVARKIGQFAIENEERRSRCQGPALLSINIAALCLVSIGVTPALAQQTSWTAGSGVNQVNWYDNANWDSGRPGTGLNAFIKMPAGSNMPIINGGTALAGDIYVGSDASASIGDGRLIMQNGSILNSDEGYIDHNASAGNNNGVFVSGAQWNNLQLVVGNLNHGLLQITNGGKVTSDIISGAGLSTGGKGEVIITGPGSQWSITNGDLKLGGSGEGIMKIANGGKMGVKSGAGTLLLAEYTGSFGGLAIGGYANDPAEAAGTLSASKIEFGDGMGNLLFNHTDTGYVFSPDISGVGTITHIAGETVLTGDGGGFSGQAHVIGGQFYVNGALGNGFGGDVTVYSNGTLGGTGNVVSATIRSGGTLAPGNSIGTLNMFSATFEGGSFYEVELKNGGFAAGTHNDLLDSTNVTINGGTVHVTPENGTDDGSTYTPGTYTIVTSANPLVGTGFDNVTDGFAFLDFTDTYDANNVYLTSTLSVTPVTGFCVSGMSANQCATGDGAFSLGAGNSVYDAVLPLSNAEAPIALDRLSGEVHASAKTMLLDDSRFPRDATMGRMRMALSGVAIENDAQDRDSLTPGVWGQAVGSWSQWDGDGNAAGLDRSIGGILMGGDASVWEDLRFGVLGGYSRSSFSVDDRRSSGTVDTYTLGAYGGGEWDSFTLMGGVAHSWHSLDTSRTVTFSGFSDSLSSSYSARTLQAWGEAAYSLEMGSARLEPFANLAYVNLSTDEFTETGGAAALTAASDTVDATFTTLGLRAEADMTLGDMDATLRGMVGWRHAFGNAPTSQMRFASGGNAFTIAGLPLAQDTLVLDAGVDVSLTERATLGLSYGGLFGSGLRDQSAKATLSVQF